jgi:methionyl-tRNA formyltransferase
MIYLFCNRGYGNLFLREFIKYIKINEIEGVIVFSGNRIKLPNRDFKREIGHFVTNLLRVIKIFFKDKLLTKQYNVKVITIDDINSHSFLSKINKYDFGIIAGFNQIFKDITIQRFHKLVNFHPSLLPFYRGPVPSYWCIRNREKYTGFTLHRVDKHIDKGEILYQEIVEINGINDADELDLKIAQAATPIMISFLDHIRGIEKLNSIIVDAEKYYLHHINYISFPRITQDEDRN